MILRNKVAEIRIITPGKEMFAKKTMQELSKRLQTMLQRRLRRQVNVKKGKLLQVH